MPRCNVSAPQTRSKPEDLMGKIRRHMPYRHQLMYEWPYTAGSLCLVVLLVSQPQQPSLARPYAHSAQRSLQEIDLSCYQVHDDALNDQHCEDCGHDKLTPSRPAADFEFSRSLLTCSNVQSVPLVENSEDRPDNMMIEVIKSNHSF